MQVFLSYREDEEGKEYASALREELAILGINAIIGQPIDSSRRGLGADDPRASRGEFRSPMYRFTGLHG